MVATAQRYCPTLVTKATEVEAKFSKVLTLFHHCHEIYDGNAVTDTQISDLGKCTADINITIYLFTHLLEAKIKEFMTYYRESFPTATVIPKMHMLEEHVVPWLKEWHLGFGMMGEQGAESIHAYFNRLGKMYDVMPDRVQRLKHKMKEHLLHVAPANVDAKPPIKKRKMDSS